VVEILSHTLTLGYEFPPGLEDYLICMFSNNAIKAPGLLEIAHYLVCICFAIYSKLQKSQLKGSVKSSHSQEQWPRVTIQSQSVCDTYTTTSM